MKKWIVIWLLAAVLLCSCGIVPETPENDIPSDTGTPVQTTPAESFYAQGSALEQKTGGAVRVYPLTGMHCGGVAVMDDSLLLFTYADGGTVLNKLSGSQLTLSASATLSIPLTSTDPSVLVNGDGISFFDREINKTVILDENLREITSIASPENMTGIPLLCADRRSLFYCAGSSLCALDLDTGIPRILRQHSADLTLDALVMEDSLLQCSQEDGKNVFISTQTGQLVAETEAKIQLETNGSHYAAILSPETRSTLVFGNGTAPSQTLAAGSYSEVVLLPVSYGVLELSGEEGLQLCYYDLSSGHRTSMLSLDAQKLVCVADGGEGIVWLLDGANTLYRWDTNALPSGDSTVYSDTYFTRARPDLSGIAQCQELAKQIGERHGVEVLVWEDALEAAPWDYRVTEEYQVPVLMEQLQLLDRRLGNFPEGFLSQLSDTCSGLTICLVQQLEGYNGLEAVEAASGVQYWVEDHAYIALSTLSSTEGGLYHELCHVIDTRVFAESNAYDQWEELNPSGFQYDYDYAANAVRNAGEYLRDAERCFIDTYSMSYPKEDRARVLEYAMTPGNEHFFQSEVMQAKLMQICLGFREAFGLKKSEETFLWEQYLNESLAYTK